MVNAREAAGEGHSRASFSVPRETAYSALTHRRQQVMSRSLFTYLIIICEVCAWPNVNRGLLVSHWIQ